MEYRQVPKTGWNVSQLSFGCMRFQDEETGAQAVRKAIEVGVNYFDIAPFYGLGTAEGYLGTGLRGLRDKAIVTAKSSPSNGTPALGDYDQQAGFGIRTADQARRQIERSMELIGVDHLDMYQLWSLHSDLVLEEAAKPGGFLEGVFKAKDEGLFDYIGMTTHSESEAVIRYLKNSPYEFDMVTLAFSPIDRGRTAAIEYCGDRGIGLIAMNPLGGGALAKPEPGLQEIAERIGCDSMVEAALRFVIGQPGVTAALNGITFADQAVQGAAAIDKGPLPADAREKLCKALDDYYSKERR